MSPPPAGHEAPEDSLNLQELIEATFNAMDALGPTDSPSGNERVSWYCTPAARHIISDRAYMSSHVHQKAVALRPYSSAAVVPLGWGHNITRLILFYSAQNGFSHARIYSLILILTAAVVFWLILTAVVDASGGLQWSNIMGCHDSQIDQSCPHDGINQSRIWQVQPALTPTLKDLAGAANPNPNPK